MGIIKYYNRLERIDQMIRLKCTGNSFEFANKLGISRSLLMQDMMVLKDLGANVSYDRIKKTFFYHEKGKLYFRFKKDNEN